MEAKRGDTVYIAAPRAQTHALDRAEAAEAADSTRYWKVDKQEEDLTGELVGLEESTRQRNREFEAKLKNIHQRCARLDGKIKAERLEGQEQHEVIMKHLKDKLATATAGIDAWVVKDITTRFTPDLEKQEARILHNEETVNEFIFVTVPGIIDAQGGAITRKLHKAHESFDIENAKISKREQKILKRFEAHVGKTAQSFEDEEATRYQRSKLWLLGEDIDECERMDDRSEEHKQASTMQSKQQLRLVKHLMLYMEASDCLVLDSMISAQQQLQKCIIETFGAGAAGAELDARGPLS
ncbi:unnamed protein product [Chrysoparadoxa australica]